MSRHWNDENSRPSCQSSFLRIPLDSTGMTRFLQELGGHCKDLSWDVCSARPRIFIKNDFTRTHLYPGKLLWWDKISLPTYNFGASQKLAREWRRMAFNKNKNHTSKASGILSYCHYIQKQCKFSVCIHFVGHEYIQNAIQFSYKAGGQYFGNILCPIE